MFIRHLITTPAITHLTITAAITARVFTVAIAIITTVDTDPVITAVDTVAGTINQLMNTTAPPAYAGAVFFWAG